MTASDEAVERISACVAAECLDSLTELVPELRLAVADGNKVIERAAETSPEVLGAALAVTKPPRESAMIFVNMLADPYSTIRADAAVIARQAIRCYIALERADECDTFVKTVDEEALRLPPATQAAILTVSLDPAQLGQSLRNQTATTDSTLINAIRKAYGSDLQSLSQFNNALN